jgi:hypothetical protein
VRSAFRDREPGDRRQLQLVWEEDVDERRQLAKIAVPAAVGSQPGSSDTDQPARRTRSNTLRQFRRIAICRKNDETCR